MVACATLFPMAGTGAVRGLQTHPVKYDPESGDPWRTTVSFQPDNAVKLLRLMRRIHPRLSAAGALDTLVALLPEPGGEPLDWETIEQHLRALLPVPEQKELPLAG
jgi:hypothetical protein